NAYFEGSDARTIDIDADLASNPDGLALGGLDGDVFVENGTAMRISTLRDQGIAGLGGSTFGDRWNDDVQALAVSTSEASTRSSATRLVRESLDAQRSSLSGVSLDEEAMNLLNFQRQYQGAARLVSVADELMQTLINLV
ncbi:MAG: hypothetical protein KDA28_05060, partial [Phycisphaerales bacterium]|nr:hypothetical protein [Phycisphaerales bacterium]